MYKSDLLTYSRFTRMSIPDEGPSNLRPACIPSLIRFGLQDPSQASLPEVIHFWRTAITFADEGEPTVPSQYEGEPTIPSQVLAFELRLLDSRPSPSASRR